MDAETREAFEQVNKRMEEIETRILERVEMTETRLLKAFLGWSQSIELQTKELPNLNQRMHLIESRIAEVERKLLEKGM